MRYMNDYDIDRARDMWADHPVLGPAIITLQALKDWTDHNSDGWAYWNKPVHAANKLMELISRDGTSKYMFDRERADATRAELTKALAPVKAFRTRYAKEFRASKGRDLVMFEITERLPTEREKLTRDLQEAERIAAEHAASADRWLAMAKQTAAKLAELDD